MHVNLWLLTYTDIFWDKLSSFHMARLMMSKQSWWKPLAVGAHQLRVKSSVVSAMGTSEHFTELDTEPSFALDLPFARAKIGSFFQEQPRLGNQFTEDITLQQYLKRHMPAQVNESFSTIRQK